MIKVITFDLDNTLWPSEAVIKNAETVLLDWLQKNCDKFPETLTSEMIHKARDRVLQNFPDLVHNVTELRRHAIKELLLVVGCDPKIAENLAEQGLAIFLAERQRITPYPESEVILKKLKSRYLLGTLTNGNADITKTSLAKYMDFSFSAEMVGFRKPHPKMFEYVLLHTNTAPHEVIHVGDHPEEDILAAKRVGFKTIWVNLTLTTWPFSEEKYDTMVNKLSDIPSQIEYVIKNLM